MLGSWSLIIKPLSSLFKKEDVFHVCICLPLSGNHPLWKTSVGGDELTSLRCWHDQLWRNKGRWNMEQEREGIRELQLLFWLGSLRACWYLRIWFMNKDLQEEREGKRRRPESGHHLCQSLRMHLGWDTSNAFRVGDERGQNRTPPDVAQHFAALKAVGSSCSHWHRKSWGNFREEQYLTSHFPGSAGNRWTLRSTGRPIRRWLQLAA